MYATQRGNFSQQQTRTQSKEECQTLRTRAEERLPPQSNHPLEACQSFFSSVSFNLASEGSDLSEASFQSELQMRQELWKLCPCKFLVTGVKRATFMAKEVAGLLFIFVNLSIVQNQRLSSIIDFLFHRLSRTIHSLIPKVQGYVGGFNIETRLYPNIRSRILFSSISIPS